MESKHESYADSFGHVYALYPRKDGTRRAAAAWLATSLIRPAEDVLCTAIEYQISLASWRCGVQYIPMFETWLRGQRWNDGFATVPERARSQVAASVYQRMEAAWWQPLASYPGVVDEDEIATRKRRRAAATWRVAQALGLTPLAGESMEQLRSRVWVAFEPPKRAVGA